MPRVSGGRNPLPGGSSGQFFAELATRHGVTIVGSLLERDKEGRHWDTATIYDGDGKLRYFTRKMHIPSGEGYHETDFFEGYHEYPVHDLGTVQLAAPTCYDQWFPELARIYALEGAELIYYPTAIGSEPTASDFDSASAWQTVMRGHACRKWSFCRCLQSDRAGKRRHVLRKQLYL